MLKNITPLRLAAILLVIAVAGFALGANFGDTIGQSMRKDTPLWMLGIGIVTVAVMIYREAKAEAERVAAERKKRARPKKSVKAIPPVGGASGPAATGAAPDPVGNEETTSGA